MTFDHATRASAAAILIAILATIASAQIIPGSGIDPNPGGVNYKCVTSSSCGNKFHACLWLAPGADCYICSASTPMNRCYYKAGENPGCSKNEQVENCGDMYTAICQGNEPDGTLVCNAGTTVRGPCAQINHCDP